MSSQNLADLDRDICQPLGRVLQEAFKDGVKRIIGATETGTVFGEQLFVEPSGTPAINEYWGKFIYMKDPGSVIGHWFGLGIGLKVANQPTYGAHFIRLYSHGTAAVESALLYANAGANKLTYLVKFLAGVAPFSSGAPSNGADAKILCKIATTEYYLALYAKG